MRRLPPQLRQKIPGKKAQKLCQLCFFFVKYLRYWVTLRLSKNKPPPLKAQEAPRGLNHCETKKKCTFTATVSQDSLVFVFSLKPPCADDNFTQFERRDWFVFARLLSEQGYYDANFAQKKMTKNSFEFHPFLIRQKNINNLKYKSI